MHASVLPIHALSIASVVEVGNDEDDEDDEDDDDMNMMMTITMIFPFTNYQWPVLSRWVIFMMNKGRN